MDMQYRDQDCVETADNLLLSCHFVTGPLGRENVEPNRIVYLEQQLYPPPRATQAIQTAGLRTRIPERLPEAA